MSVHEYFELSEKDFELYMEVPVCGCGNPEVLYELYRRFLATTPSPSGEEWTYGPRERMPGIDPLLWEVLAGVIDDLGATDHGGNMHGCWRTDKGDRLLDILDRYAEDYDRMPCSGLEDPAT